MSDQAHDPMPEAPTAEAWEPFLRRPRQDDGVQLGLTLRQVARIQYILGFVALPETCAEPQKLADQSRLLSDFFGALYAETSTPDAYAGPSSAERWDLLEQEPYYIQSVTHQQALAERQA